MTKAVFFDFDGVLFDTSAGIFASFRQALSENGLEVPPDSVLHDFIGPPIYVTMQTYFHLEGERFRKVYRDYRKAYDEANYLLCTPAEGMRELLEYLKERGIISAVVSFKARPMTIKILSAFGMLDLFTGGIGGTEGGGTTSDKSDVARERLQAFGLQGGEVLFVGDRKYDIQAAHACGIKCAAVTWGFGSLEEFRRHGADFIVDSPRDIRALCGTGPDDCI